MIFKYKFQFNIVFCVNIVILKKKVKMLSAQVKCTLRECTLKQAETQRTLRKHWLEGTCVNYEACVVRKSQLPP